MTTQDYILSPAMGNGNERLGKQRFKEKIVEISEMPKIRKSAARIVVAQRSINQEVDLGL